MIWFMQQDRVPYSDDHFYLSGFTLISLSWTKLNISNRRIYIQGVLQLIEDVISIIVLKFYEVYLEK